MSKPLAADIVSLIHHVELNESGWWKKAIGQVVKGCLWKSHSSLELSELQSALKADLGVTIADDVLLSQLDSLIGQAAVTRLGVKYALTQAARSELTSARDAAEAEQEQCEAIFISACSKFCPALDSADVYKEFTRTLHKSVQVSGANLFHLIADGKLEKDVDWLSPFLSKFSLSHQEDLRLVLNSFFEPSNKVCRGQVLRLLTAHFFAEATQLSSSTLKVIEQKRKKRSIKVVLDTNFLFSILQLHENPGDESAISLVEIAQRKINNFDISLYVIPSTLEEAKRVLISQISSIERIKTSRAMSKAALNFPLSSIARKFFEAASQIPGLSASSYFSPYIDDLQTVLKGKGIKVLDAHPGIYHQRQDVLDDVLAELEKEKQDVPEPKRKNYETLRHDAVLWHAVKDKRQSIDTSPFEVEYWAVSIDWRLIGFDRQKRINDETTIPVVLHPSSLMQFIQFWIPRSPELDEVLVDSLRLPLYFQAFDPEDEKATVKVLEAISRFERAGDFTESTIRALLTNQALRNRLKTSSASNEEVFEMVRDEIVAEHNLALGELGETKDILGKVVDDLQFLESEHGSVLGVLDEAKEALKQTTEELDAERERAGVLEKNYELTLNEKTQVEIESFNAHVKLAKLNYLFFIVFLPLFFGVFLLGGVYVGLPGFFSREGFLNWLPVLACLISPIFISVCYSPKYTEKNKYLAGWKFSDRLNGVGNVAKWVSGLAVSSIFAGAVWDGVKYFLNFK